MILEVKDIRQFRTFYKEKVKRRNLANQNEHFVGVSKYFPNGDVEFGFFELFHGDKEGKTGAAGIKGYLTGLLDMAKDGQAIYEFMQNAIDAGSSKLGLFFEEGSDIDQSYLLVINNGRPFSLKDIRSILNVGVSTKSDDRSNIGKFGIGFKLAHRLVGKQNGLIELVDKNYGPILFSWQNNEIRQIILDDKIEVESIKQQYITVPPAKEHDKPEFYCNDEAPWYFKILSTVFPCGINDVIYDNHHNLRENVFSKEESDKFFSWIKRHENYINEDFKQGSAFFMRLGEGKIKHLKNERLIEGIKFSLSILNHLLYNDNSKLKELKLNSKLIEAIDLSFIRIIIDNDSVDYKYILGENTNEDFEDTVRIDRIEILFGYVDYKKSNEVFKNSPNFYLFFPLSEEKHDFRFIIHSNAFDKSASRTYLLNGEGQSNGINERLFEVFQKIFLRKLASLLETGKAQDKEIFLNIYANLLLSNQSQNQREWVNEPLYFPILNWLRSNIPVYRSSDKSFEICHKRDSVYILKVGIPLPIEKLININLHIFYWSSDKELSNKAEYKFDLRTIDIYRILISPTSFQVLNDWFDEEDNEKYLNKALSELDEVLAKREVYTNANFQKSFEEIRWFKFSDNSRFSLNQLREKEVYAKYLLRLDVFDDISNTLERVGFIFTEIKISDYPNIQKYLLQIRQNFIPYTIYENIPDILNLQLETGSQKLGTNSKIELIKGVYKIDEKNRNKEERQRRVSKLLLFRNKKGTVTSLSKLVYQVKYSWLKRYEIQDSEYDDELAEYLIKNDSQLYNDIILPNWNDIVENSKDKSELFNDTVKLYDSTYPTLHTRKYFVIDGVPKEFTSDGFYYNSHLNKLNTSKYSYLKSFFHKAFQLKLPDYEILSFLNDNPFLTKSMDIPSTFRVGEVFNFSEIETFLTICRLESYQVFEGKSILKVDKGYTIESITNKKINCITNDVFEAKLIRDYLTELYLIPSEFNHYKGLGAESDSILSNRIIEKLAEREWTNETIYSDYLLSLNDEFKLRFCRKCLNIQFNIDLPLNQNLRAITFLRILLSLPSEMINSNEFANNLFLIKDLREIPLSSLVKIPAKQIVFENGGRVDITKLFNKHQDYGLDEFFSKLHEWNFGDTEIRKIKSIFEYSSDINILDVLNELIDTLPDKVLQNDEQLFFVLNCLATENYKSNIPDDLKVRTAGNSVIEILHINILGYAEDQFIFFDDDYILHEQYLGLKSKIEQFPLPKEINPKIISRPIFFNNVFISAPFKRIHSNDQVLEFVKWLYQFWISETNGYGELDFEWSKVFPFNPKNFVITDTAIESENLPGFLNVWVEEDQGKRLSKRHLMKKLGVNTKSSAVHRLRLELFNPLLLDFKEQIQEINSKSSIILANCIEYYNLKSEFKDFKTDDRIFLVFNSIYNLIDKETLSNSLLPIERKKGVYNFSWRNEGDWLLDYESKQQMSHFGIGKENLRENFINFQIFDSIQFSFLRLIAHHFTLVRLSNQSFDKEEANKNSNEWNNKFYIDWKEKYGYSIYSIDCEIPWIISVNDLHLYNYNSGRFHFENREIFVDSTLNKFHALKTIKDQNILPDAIIQELFNSYDIYQQKLNTYIAEIESGEDEELRDKWESFKREIEVEEQKKEITRNLNNSEIKYSVNWFINYLELLVISSDKADNREIEREISFSKVEISEETKNLITLRDPSRTITPTIEYCTDFYATIHYGQRKIESIKINGVTKKGQTLIVLIKDISFLNSIPVSQINRVEISFSGAIDLLERLKKSFNNVLNRLHTDINEHILSYLPDKVKFIFGPPGTGKTTWLSKHIINEITNRQLKILILTPTNKAADVISEKIIEIVGVDEAMLWLVRYGTTQSKSVFENDLMYDRNTFFYDRFNNLVFVSTIHRFPYEEIFITDKPTNEIKKLCDCQWDMVIFDEASMIPLPYIVFSLLVQSINEPPEFFVAGDPFQIPPVIVFDDKDLDEADLKEENIYSLINLKTFEPDKQKHISKYGDQIINLTTQYRSLPEIGKLFDSYTYSDNLIHYRENNGNTTAKTKFGILNNLFKSNIGIIRFPVNEDDTVYKPEKLKRSPYQLYSALLVSEIIKRINKEIETSNDTLTIGIICPYRAQASLINKIIETEPLNQKLNIITDTVHGFQGDECDIVFALFNPSQLRISSDQRLFLNKQYLINVAISRAKDYLLLIYPDDSTQGIFNLREIKKLESIQRDKIGLNVKNITIEAKSIENYLFGYENYFEKNTFTNIHQDVNVYHKPEMKYIVKFGNNAVDLQIKE